MSRLDEVLPAWDARERHQREVHAAPEDAVASALGIPVTPDALVRTLFRLRGLPGGGSVHGALRAIGLQPLVHEPDCVVFGAAGRPWSPRSGLSAFEQAGPGQIRMVLELSATATRGGSALLTAKRAASLESRSRPPPPARWLSA